VDLNLTAKEEQFRDDFRAWLAVNLPPEWTASTNGEDRAEYLRYLPDGQGSRGPENSVAAAPH
jgi:hypothetical protein